MHKFYATGLCHTQQVSGVTGSRSSWVTMLQQHITSYL